MSDDNKENVDNLNIYQRINAVKEHVKALGKNTTVGSGKSSYKALTHDKVTDSLRGPMMKYGIISHVVKVEESTNHSEYDETNNYGTKKKFRRFTSVKITMQYTCMDDPTSYITVESIGHGEDSGDKAAGKAISYATKYAHLKTFDIVTGENDEIRLDDDIIIVSSSVDVVGELVKLGFSKKSVEDVIASANMTQERLSNGWNDTNKRDGLIKFFKEKVANA